MDGVVLAGAQAPIDLRSAAIDRVPLLRGEGATILERTCRSMLDAGCENVFVPATAAG